MTQMRKGNLFWKDNVSPNSKTNPVHAKDVNSDGALAKLEQTRLLLDSISKVDFATGATLEQARVLLASLGGKDFATNTKLEQVRVLLASLDGKDFSTQATLAQAKSELELVKSELGTIKANQLSGDQKVQLSGNMTEHYGADVNSRPPADTVLAGATFTIVDDSGYFQTWISDGTKWVEV